MLPKQDKLLKLAEQFKELRLRYQLSRVKLGYGFDKEIAELQANVLTSHAEVDLVMGEIIGDVVKSLLVKNPHKETPTKPSEALGSVVLHNILTEVSYRDKLKTIRELEIFPSSSHLNPVEELNILRNKVAHSHPRHLEPMYKSDSVSGLEALVAAYKICEEAKKAIETGRRDEFENESV